jgi:hypothetical protein
MNVKLELDPKEVREAVDQYLSKRMGHGWHVSGATLIARPDGTVTATAEARPNTSGGKD